MSAVTLEEAQAHLPELIEQLQPGQDITITRNHVAVARLTSDKHTDAWPCKAGSYKKSQYWMSADFDSPLDDFKDYME
jgi:antitoxin (DNA-binding transcriptional repressor) of toxin-antitoxin stability system